MQGKKMTETRTISYMCRLWDDKDVELLMSTLRDARSSGFRRSLPNVAHTPLGNLMEALDPLFRKYATPVGDREAIKDVLIGEMQSGYRYELLETPEPLRTEGS
jgi:hypothetical protein